MPSGNAHRILNTLFEAFDPVVGPGILQDPGDGGTIDPCNDPSLNFQICEMTSTGAETRTLANPDRPGVRFILRLLTDGGNVVVTASNGLNVLLETEATFADESDFLSLVSVSLPVATGGYRWEVMEGNAGTVISSSSPSSSASSSPSSSASSSPSSSVSSSPSSSPSAT